MNLKFDIGVSPILETCSKKRFYKILALAKTFHDDTNSDKSAYNQNYHTNSFKISFYFFL
jgi:hypothetical protein